MLLGIGTQVQEIGPCRHKAGPKASATQSMAECFHTRATIVHTFRDEMSYWVTNPYGFAKRLLVTRIVGGNQHERDKERYK